MSTEVQFNLYDFSEETLEFLYDLPTEFPPSPHTHVVADITDLPDLVNGTGTISVGAIEAIGLDVEEDATINGTLNADDIQGNLTGSVYVSVRAGETLLKGYPVYVSGTYTSGAISLPIVSRADSSDSAKMPAVGIMDADLGTGYNGNMVISGRVSDFNTNAYNLNAELYVASGGGFTATAPTSRAQVVARVERKDSNYGSVIVSIGSISSITSATTSDGTAQLDIASLGFNTSSALTSGVGELVWNDVDGTLDLGLKGGNVTLQIGQESVTRVVNKTGANLLESQYRVVRIRSTAEGGTQGQRLAVVLAQANNDPNSVDTMGIVTEDINVNQEGFITTSGVVRNINTTGSLQGEIWVDGDVLYLSPTTAGVLTNVKPQAPNHTIIVGFVIYKHATQGKIYVKVDNGYEIDELHNVKITDVANNDVLKYNSTTGVWENTDSLSLSSLVIGASTPNPKAALDIQSTTQGFLPPRMTSAARDAIASPPHSLIVYNTSTNAINLHNGTAWGNVLTTHSASFTSATLAAAVSDETGSGSLVFAASPTLTSPTLSGTPVFNATTYTYVPGAATAHRAALNVVPLVEPEIIRGMQLKLAADDLQYQGSVTIANNDTVATWRSQNKPLTITAEVLFSQTTVGSRPIYQTNIQNSLPGVFFNGTSNVMTSNASMMSLLGANARTVFVVCRPTAVPIVGAGSTWNRPQIYGNSGQFNGMSVSPSGAANIITAWDYDSTTPGINNRSVATIAIAPNTTILLTHKHEKGVTSLSLNQGTPVTTSVLRDCLANSILQLGSNGAGSGFYQGYIFEILMYSRVLTIPETLLIESYLKTKWNI